MSMAHAYIPSYLGGWEQEYQRSSHPWHKGRPRLQNNQSKMNCRVVSRSRLSALQMWNPEFNPSTTRGKIHKANIKRLKWKNRNWSLLVDDFKMQPSQNTYKATYRVQTLWHVKEGRAKWDTYEDFIIWFNTILQCRSMIEIDGPSSVKAYFILKVFPKMGSNINCNIYLPSETLPGRVKLYWWSSAIITSC
jgi:hypothetical protein